MATPSGLTTWANALSLHHPHDVYRSELNGRNIRQAIIGHQFAALAQLVYAAKVWLRDAKPDLALTILPSALAEQLHMVLLASSRRWRSFYARHKEPLLLVSWALDLRSLVALNVHSNRQWEAHSGSALRLLLLLLVTMPAFWQMFATVSTPHVVRWTCFSLPLCALYMLTSNSTMCARVLSASGVREPLAALHGSLTLAHLPISMSAGAYIAQAGGGPESECLALHGWLTVVVGVLLPLCIAARQELRGRNQLLRAYAAQLPAEELRPVQEHHLGQVALLRLFSLRNVYLASCLVWGVACTLSL